MYKIYDFTLYGYELKDNIETNEQLLSYAQGICNGWEYTICDKLPKYHRYIDTNNGNDIY